MYLVCTARSNVTIFGLDFFIFIIFFRFCPCLRQSATVQLLMQNSSQDIGLSFKLKIKHNFLSNIFRC